MEIPVEFAHYTRALLGDEEYQKLIAALEEQRVFSIRLNKLSKWRIENGELRNTMQRDSAAISHFSILNSQFIKWSTEGFYLPHRLTFTFDPLFHAGCYYVQEASSMFVEQVLRQYLGDAPAVMLDLCAAPGGKSTHARSVLPQGSLLVANEVIRNRSQILAENLTKWGHPGVVVTNNDPADFSRLNSFFDVILTDVPCSGEGMFRKDPIALSEWSPENVEICRQRQQRIIADIWPCLKPGGLLIYSTCTYNTKENEENIRWIRDEFGAEILPVEAPTEWNITGNLLAGEDFPVYRFLPHKTRGEGFFLAVLRKAEETEMAMDEGASTQRYKTAERQGYAPAAAQGCKPSGGQNYKSASARGKKNAAPTVSKDLQATARNWLLSADDYELSAGGTNIIAFPRESVSELSALQQSLRIVQAGIALAEVKGKDLIPNHALAMSCALRPDAFPREEVAYEQAIAYLRKEAIVLPADAPRGYVLLTYKGIPLGFVKNIGNRANNLYPQEWRIRSGYLPEEILVLG